MDTGQGQGSVSRWSEDEQAAGRPTSGRRARIRVNEQPISTFQEAIQATHGCRSSLRERVEVQEAFKGKPVWEGEVLVFDLFGHPTAPVCYAWEVDGTITAVLHEWPVDSPSAAVRASIVEGYQKLD